MFISNSKKFIYIHLHKCAGTAVEVALSGTLKWNDLLLGSTKDGETLQHTYQKLFGLYKHSTAREVKAVIGEPTWNDYFKFSTVRNPYSLAVSQYTYSMQHLLWGMQKLKRQPMLEGTFWNPARYDMWPFNYPGVRALLATGGVNSRFGDFIRAPALSGWSGFSPQIDQLGNGNGDLIVDQVIKVEELGEQWPGLCERLQVGNLPIGRENRSTDGARDYREFYSNIEDEALIRILFRQDFEHLGYSEQL
jgi:hypothetical protein